jgi:hypothetical protein
VQEREHEGPCCIEPEAIADLALRSNLSSNIGYRRFYELQGIRRLDTVAHG